MFKWLSEYSESRAQTKYFVLNALVYMLAIVITTAYCYGRLDFVRSYRTPAKELKENKENREIKEPTVQQTNLQTTPNHK